MTEGLNSEQAKAMAILLENIIRSIYSERTPGQLLPLQWSILRYLKGCETQHASIGYIGRFLGLTHAPVSRSVATLKKRGLIEPVPTSEGLRGSALSLTQKGHDALKNDPLNGIGLALTSMPPDLSIPLKRAVEHLIVAVNKVQEEPK
jgi:DNA-binding MarR family transcriptional regulator